MPDIKTLAPGHRSILAPLFKNHIRQRVVIDSVLEQPWGRAIADSDTRPQIARLQLAGFTMFAGDPEHPLAPKIISDHPTALIIAETDAWKAIILRLLGERITPRKRFGFSLEHLDIAHVRALSRRVPEGYQIQQVDRHLAPHILSQVDYSTPETFLEHGIGFCAMQDDRIASAALSYTNSTHGIETQIYTHNNHQRKGLATVTGATLIAHCLKHNIDPHWSAANPISARLARNLGYVQNDAYDVLIYR